MYGDQARRSPTLSWNLQRCVQKSCLATKLPELRKIASKALNTAFGGRLPELEGTPVSKAMADNSTAGGAGGPDPNAQPEGTSSSSGASASPGTVQLQTEKSGAGGSLGDGLLGAAVAGVFLVGLLA